MTGTVIELNQKSGATYLYIKLSYKDIDTHKWKQKIVSTGLPTRGNRKKAAELIPGFIQKYSYLEQKGTNEKY